MKTKLKLVIVVLLLSTIHPLLSTCFAQGTAFTYQGRLNDGAGPANGSYDLTFTLFNAGSGPAQVGTTLTNAATAVSNGLFTVTLDFGSQFPGADRWLEIGVRTNGGGAFTSLTPRQALTPTPYAITAGNLSGALSTAQLSGQLTGSQIANGAVGAAQVDPTAVQVRVTGTAPAGQFITRINADGSVNVAADSSDWKLGGNNVTPGQFLGATNGQTVELRVNNQTVVRYLASPGVPNVVGGAGANAVAAGIEAATIGGGGTDLNPNRVNASYGTIGGGTSNTVNGAWSTISGGRDNSVLSDHSIVAGGRANTVASNNAYSVISGGYANLADTNSSYGTIGGGWGNRVTHTTATVGGGFFNSALYDRATVAGGALNFIGFGDTSFIGGGSQNTINNGLAVIVGGQNNTNNGSFAAIGGGRGNLIDAYGSYGAIPGGYLNLVTGNGSFAAGQQAWAVHNGTFVWADGAGTPFLSTGTNQFLIRAGGGVGINTNNPNGAALNVAGTVVATTVQSANFSGNGAGLTNVNAPTLGGLASSNFWQLGGNNVTAGQFLGSINNQAVEIGVNGTRALRLEPNTSGAPNLIGGSPLNTVAGGIVGATISGGGATNFATGTFFGSNPSNSISANFGAIGGGAGNSIQTASAYSALGGGFGNLIQSNAPDSFIGGGNQNLIQGSLVSAVIAGGDQNRIMAQASFSTIGGGGVNTISSNAYESVISGGEANFISTNSHHAAIGGGSGNVIVNNSAYATIPGGDSNSATNYAFAAGRRAKANHQGAFVWADSQNADFVTTANDQAIVRAAGGVGINTNNPGATLDVNGSLRVGNGTTIFSSLQAGLAQMATDSATVKTNFTFTFPKAYTAVPNVLVSGRADPLQNVDDTFAVSVRRVTTTNCTVNITRTDTAAGWGQHVQVTWMAWQ